MTGFARGLVVTRLHLHRGVVVSESAASDALCGGGSVRAFPEAGDVEPTTDGPGGPPSTGENGSHRWGRDICQTHLRSHKTRCLMHVFRKRLEGYAISGDAIPTRLTVAGRERAAFPRSRRRLNRSTQSVQRDEAATARMSTARYHEYQSWRTSKSEESAACAQSEPSQPSLISDPHRTPQSARGIGVLTEVDLPGRVITRRWQTTHECNPRPLAYSGPISPTPGRYAKLASL